MSSNRSWTVAVCALAAALCGCPDDTKLQGLCAEDVDCPTGFKCIDSRCVCTTDTACAPNETCNAAGFCQLRVGCDTSLDCPQGQICDRASGQCIPADYCTDDVQCPLEQICDSVRLKCIDACRDAGDCKLGSICECATGTSCAVGKCKSGPCGDNSFCQFGEICVEDAPGAEKRCRKDERGPYCDPCTFAPGAEYCPYSEAANANYCLVDTTKGFGSYFCGVECEVDGECPWGFGCNDVLILTEQTCGGSGQIGQCPLRGNRECTKNEDCRGGECDTTVGKCRSLCVGGESDVQGFCTCMEDTDCPKDVCDTTSRRCSISLDPCDPNIPSSCGNIYCKQVTDPQSKVTLGYCFIGRNCAPVEGVTCDMVRAARK